MRFVAPSRASVSAPSRHRLKSLEQNLQVAAQTPRPDVFPVQLHGTLKGWIAPRRHLPEPGNSRSYIQTGPMPYFIGCVFVYRVWPWPHQAHIADQNIPQLRKLIEAVAP